ncbi:MAG: DUF3783 domain-containing protein [Eubacteriales bacterium]|nr:DUF3783 domain-containing protein [Eubacteriales bacterium]
MAKDELVLLYQLDATSEKGLKIREILSRLNIRAKTVSHAMLSQTIGHLADLPGHAPHPSEYNGEPIPDEVLLMKDLSDTRIDRLLKDFRENGVSRIDLKAVVTPHNQKWTLLDLITELRQEHAVMGRFNQLHQSVQMADRLLAGDTASDSAGAPVVAVLTPASQNLSAAVREARALLSTRELPEMDQIDAILARLKTALADYQAQKN